MKYFGFLFSMGVVLCLLLYPLLNGDATFEALAVDFLLLTAAASAWNIFSGFTGYISLGHAVYYGIGAYALALTVQGWHVPGGWGPLLLLPVAGLLCGVCAVPLGWIALHTRRTTFIVLTIAIFFIFQLLAFNLSSITGGSAGIFLPLPNWQADLLNLPFYYVAGGILVLATFLSWWIRNSKYGLILLAIRDDEDRAWGLGIRIERYMLGVYVLSAVLIGMVGACTIYFQGLVTPSVAFDESLNLTVAVVCLFGGLGTVSGSVVGALLFVPIEVFLQQNATDAVGLNQLLFGCFLLAIVLLVPAGVVPSLSKRWQGTRLFAGQQQVQTRALEMSPSSKQFLLADCPRPRFYR